MISAKGGKRTQEQKLWLARAVRFLWYSLLVCIPITSFPVITRLVGGTLVGPLSLISLSALYLVWLVPYIRRGGTLPYLAVPLLAFVLIALASTALAAFLEIYPRGEALVVEHGVEGLGSLAIGLGFYLVAATVPSDERRFRDALRWISLGGLLMLLYSTIQLSWILSPDEPIPYKWRDLHRLLSVRDPFNNRVTGMAFEPSWAADQLVILYLPLWMAAVGRGESFLLSGRQRPSPELVLAAWGVLILYFTFSRIGLLALIGMLGLGLAVLNWNWMVKRSIRNRSSPGQPTRDRLVLGLRTAAGGLLTLSLVVVLSLGLLALAARIDSRIARLFQVDFLTVMRSSIYPWIYSLANRLAYAERLMYWIAAFRVFSLHPLLGVGLGNVGLFFEDTVPSFGFHLPEILSGLASGIPNSKSLWIRLLAETGLFGFVTFVTWLLLHAEAGARWLRRQRGVYGLIGLACILSLIAQVFEGFSLDTFALPQLWIILGLVASASTLAHRGESQEVSGPRRPPAP